MTEDTTKKTKAPAKPKKPAPVEQPGAKPKKAAAKPKAKKPAPAPRAKRSFGSKPTDPETLFGLLMAARRQGGGILEERAAAWLLEIGIKVTFPKSRGLVAHVPSGS